MKYVLILFVSIFSIHCIVVAHLLKGDYDSYCSMEEALENRLYVKYLYIANKGLEKIPKHLPELVNLVTLELPSNKIDELPQLLCRMRNLSHIYLDKNNFSSLPPFDCKTKQLLSLLSLTHNRINTFPNDLTQFRYSNLDLSYNQIEFLPENITWYYIFVLNLSHNKITKLPKEFNKNHIYILNVSHNQLTTLPDRLGVYAKEKSKFGFVYYHNQQHLVDFSYNKIEKIPDAFLRNNKKIKKLVLTGNPLSEVEVEKVRRALPDTEVVF